MERALLREMEELERTIGELTRRKARKAGAITSPEWQTPAVRVSRRPGGFSGRQEDPASESWAKVAADVQRYAREVYPEFDAAAQEKLGLHAFLRALTPERLRDHVSLAKPGSISEALSKTTQVEDTLAIRPTPQPTRQHFRVADGEEVRWTRTPLQRPVRRQGRCYRCDEPGHIARDCPAPAPKPQKPPPSGNEAGTVHWTGRPAEPWWTRATISLVRPGVLHNTGGPQLPGAWTPTATPLTSVTGAKMAMRGKKEVKVTVTGQEVSHEFWLADIADSCIIGLDLLKRWGACVDVSRASITLGMETVALQSGPTQKPARRPRHLATTARPASKLLQLATAPKPPSLTTVPQPDHSLAHHHQPATQQPPAQPKPALPAEMTAAVHALWQRSSSGLNHQQRQQLKSLLDGNADLFAVRDEDCTQTELVQDTMNTDTAQPIRLLPHRMSPTKRLVAEEKVKEMAAAGVIEPSDSPCGPGPEEEREWRFCVDYRHLNSATTKDSYPLPRIDEALDHISGSSWFSSLDLRSGYWQVRLAPEAKPKTAFTIGQGLWQFRVMPFGLCNAPATFERLMERVLAAVPRSRCVVYLDDLLVHASDFQQALANLTDVLAAIRQAGLRLNPKKCQLLRRETAFLGHIVSERGIATDPSKVAAVRDWPVPGNVGELRSFLGLASYYRRFVRDFATLASPLHRLTDKCRPFVWQEGQSMAFDQLRAALTEAPVLAYPDALRPFIVDTDASNTGVGAVLSQEDEDGERVVAYYSRALGKAERNYCVTRRELLAVVRALHHFRPYLQGSHFLLRTDHASLTWLLNFKDPEGKLLAGWNNCKAMTSKSGTGPADFMGTQTLYRASRAQPRSVATVAAKRNGTR
ncbi:hypothetical protein SKAU_G00134590 [Synaphobranchus kaupii]|uniref:ribonuclease H n=1 Tax=Synaphobranchus kaupii TaxID=118154 RepID=A0A9Q1FS26_SYNKA|nr:hypothetical protein SKAU_G00134590 [Synaphobranchus kaupii]